MSELVHGLDDLVGEWVARRVPEVSHAGDWGPFRAIGVAEERRLLAGAVFTHYDGNDIRLSFASDDPRWATRRNIAGILGYPFRVGCSRITCIADKRNKRVRKLLRGLGFIEEGVHRNGFGPGTVAVSYGLLPGNSKYLESEDGKEEQRLAGAA